LDYPSAKLRTGSGKNPVSTKIVIEKMLVILH